MAAPKTNTDAVYDASTLGTPKRLLLGVQHLFAMFGATVLVPALTGLDVANALLFAGLGTLLFHLITGRKVPAFLGSSFAFIGGYNAIRAMGGDGLLPYACFGVACAGLVYLVMALLFKQFGAKKVMRYFPPIVTGPIIICIGLSLAGSAINNCQNNWLVALVAILVVVVCNIWGKGMVKIVPILLGVVASYLFALIIDPAARANVAQTVADAKWFGLPVIWGNTAFSIFGNVKMNAIFHTPLITITYGKLLPVQQIIKRAFDILFSLLAMILLSPVYLITAITIYTTSKGPIFYKQERIGYKGKPFYMHKFRSMYTDAEKDGPRLSNGDKDSRITPFGRFMRKVRLDEIPQFYNVLKGTMSLVGYRPERQYFIDRITEKAPEYKLLLRVKPGITSWGQVKFGYADTVEQMVERLKYDLLYMENISLATDIKILFYTFVIILQGRGK